MKSGSAIHLVIARDACENADSWAPPLEKSAFLLSLQWIPMDTQMWTPFLHRFYLCLCPESKWPHHSSLFPTLPLHRPAAPPRILATGPVWGLLWPLLPRVKFNTHIPDGVITMWRIPTRKPQTSLCSCPISIVSLFFPCSNARYKNNSAFHKKLWTHIQMVAVLANRPF